MPLWVSFIIFFHFTWKASTKNSLSTWFLIAEPSTPFTIEPFFFAAKKCRVCLSTNSIDNYKCISAKVEHDKFGMFFPENARNCHSIWRSVDNQFLWRCELFAIILIFNFIQHNFKWVAWNGKNIIKRLLWKNWYAIIWALILQISFVGFRQFARVLQFFGWSIKLL